jgi:Uma2 family endonuclease
VKVLILDAPQKMLDERRALGLDGRDEMWDGVLHMVPPPSGPHQRLSSRLHVVLAPPASARGLEASMDTGLFQSEIEYRVPDQMFYRPEQASQRGAEGAELVVEVRSPGDETYEKMDCYARLGVREVLVLYPLHSSTQLFKLEEGRMRQVPPGMPIVSEVLGITVRTGDMKFQITWDGGSAEI